MNITLIIGAAAVTYLLARKKKNTLPVNDSADNTQNQSSVDNNVDLLVSSITTQVTDRYGRNAVLSGKLSFHYPAGYRIDNCYLLIAPGNWTNASDAKASGGTTTIAVNNAANEVSIDIPFTTYQWGFSQIPSGSNWTALLSYMVNGEPKQQYYSFTW